MCRHQAMGRLKKVKTHYSHFSSAGTSQPSPTTSQDYSTNSVYSAGGSVRGARSKNQFSPVSSQKDASLYKLGDRTLKKGMFGNDVEELSKILIALNYLTLEDCVKQKGFSFFDEKMEDAIKRFQSSHKMRDTGIVDSNLVSILKRQEH